MLCGNGGSSYTTGCSCGNISLGKVNEICSPLIVYSQEEKFIVRKYCIEKETYKSSVELGVLYTLQDAHVKCSYRRSE